MRTGVSDSGFLPPCPEPIRRPSPPFACRALRGTPGFPRFFIAANIDDSRGLETIEDARLSPGENRQRLLASPQM